MSHDIDMTSGRAGMAYVGTEGTPWHGLGTVIEKGAKIEQIAEAAALNWPVIMTPSQFTFRGKLYTDERHQHMVRGDTMAVLDVTGPGYVPHQNIEVLEFFQEYLTAGDMFIDTAGSLDGGRMIWVLAKMEKGFTLPGKDKVGGYILLANPHVYGKGMIGKVTFIRVVCRNTIMMALNGSGKSIKVWHTQEFNKARRDQAKENLGIAKERLDAFKEDAEKLVAVTLPLEDAIKLIAEVFDPAKVERPLEQQGRTVNRIIELYNGAGMGATLVSAKDTMWGLLNAATQFIDHEYGRTNESRLENAWLGNGDIQKRSLLTNLLAAARDN